MISEETLKIDQDHVVSLSYILTVNETSETIEEVTAENPLNFIYGKGTLLPRFEAHLKNLSVGENFDFVLTAEEAYGQVNESAITELPKSIFEVDGVLREDLVKLGNVVPMRDSQGRRIDGKVIAITDDTVRMDFNHPMAGKDLNFKGKVVDLRKATAEEIEFGLGGQSCGCGDNSCGTDHGDSCSDGSCSGCGC